MPIEWWKWDPQKRWDGKTVSLYPFKQHSQLEIYKDAPIGWTRNMVHDWWKQKRVILSTFNISISSLVGQNFMRFSTWSMSNTELSKAKIALCELKTEKQIRHWPYHKQAGCVTRTTKHQWWHYMFITIINIFETPRT